MRQLLFLGRQSKQLADSSLVAWMMNEVVYVLLPRREIPTEIRPIVGEPLFVEGTESGLIFRNGHTRSSGNGQRSPAVAHDRIRGRLVQRVLARKSPANQLPEPTPELN